MSYQHILAPSLSHTNAWSGPLLKALGPPLESFLNMQSSTVKLAMINIQSLVSNTQLDFKIKANKHVVNVVLVALAPELLGYLQGKIK